MATYSLQHPEKGLITYTDKKRYLWLMSVLMPAFPLTGVAIFYQTGAQWVLGVPLVVAYLIIPILDYLVGRDENNPPEELVPQLEADKYYRILTMLTVPFHFIVLGVMAYVVGTNDLSRRLQRSGY